MTTLRRAIAGFTLIELMISLAIGTIVTGAGLTLYVQVSKSRHLIQAELNLQRDSYFVNQTLRQLLNQAGYRPLNDTLFMFPLLPVSSQDQSFTSVTDNWNTGDIVRALDNGLAIRFEGASDAAGVADGSIINCQGEAIASGVVTQLEITVEDGGLLCTSDGVTVDLISDDDDVQVEQLVVNWGVDTNNDSSIDEYRISSANITNSEALMSVRIMLLLSSKAEVQTNSSSYHFNGVEYTSTDKKLRRELITTVQLKH
jgi:prepilin-type N-terminal cleavage/methylation domain-containing protein